MMRFMLAALVALSVVGLEALADDAKDKKDANNPASVDDQVKALKKDFAKSMNDAVKVVRAAKDAGERNKAMEAYRKVPTDFAARFMSIAEKNAKDPAAVDALLWILLRAPQAPELAKAAKLLETQYLQSDRFKTELRSLGHSDAPEVEHLVRALLERNKDAETEGRACYALGMILKNKAGNAEQIQQSDEARRKQAEQFYGKEKMQELLALDCKKVKKDAEGLFDTCVAKHGGYAVVNSEDTLGDLAKGELFELRELAIGKVAPDIVGADLDGKEFKLSDYRGKVVMLNYWGSWCGPCMALVPHERELVKRFEGKPFVLVGVNSDKDLEKLKPRLEKEQITWRSFWNGSSGPPGPIAKKWNVHAWPTIYMIDQTGVIRHHYVGSPGNETIDKVVETLVQSAEKAGTKSSSAK